jgi:RNA polymerase sigma-70 factor (ECF subfamily)
MQLTNFSSLLARMESFHKYGGSFPERQTVPKDQQSFAELVHTYFPVLSHFAFSIVKDEESAKDIVQEVFVRYWNGNEEFREFASLKAWLYQSTRNRCLNEIRSRQRSETHHTNAYPREEPGEDNILANIVSPKRSLRSMR